MTFRTDLALEAQELDDKNTAGVSVTKRREHGMTVTTLAITTDEAAKRLQKERGTYITCEFKALTDDFKAADSRVTVIGELMRPLIPKKGCVLVAGIGNGDITADALGPAAASRVLATRHIAGETARALGFEDLRSVCVLSPGVLGQTGIEVRELLGGVIRKAGVSCVIAIDALASRRLSRLGCTVQISDTGIAPGAGVGNHRGLLNEKTLGVPVIAVGVPTVVDAATLACDLLFDGKGFDSAEARRVVSSGTYAGMVVTPREIDLLTSRASLLIGMAINTALQPSLTPDELFALI